MRLVRPIVSTVAALAAILALGVSASQASYHEMKIRQLYAGTIAGGQNDSFVALQMYASGQNLVAGKQILLYSDVGSVLDTFTFPSNAANAENQRTILVGDTGVANRDFTADFQPPGFGSSGAVCYVDPGPPVNGLDCVSWGDFTGAGALPSPTGTPAQVLDVDGQALLRSITPNCPTQLEDADDTNNSAVDFSLEAPNPLSNSVTPTEPNCASNKFEIGKVKGKKVSIDVPGEGRVDISDANAAKKPLLKPSTTTAGAAGTVKASLKLTKSAKKKLKKKGKLKVNAAVTFTPTGGVAATQNKGLKLKK